MGCAKKSGVKHEVWVVGNELYSEQSIMRIVLVQIQAAELMQFKKLLLILQ